MRNATEVTYRAADGSYVTERIRRHGRVNNAAGLRFVITESGARVRYIDAIASSRS